MNRFLNIPIRLESSARTGGLGGGVLAVLNELLGLLERLANGGLDGSVDLRSLPMSPEDRLELNAALGEGEVKAILNAGGESSIRESGVSGVWWIEHRDLNGEIVAESLEVTRIPQILESSLEEIVSSASILRTKLAMTSPVFESVNGYASRQ